MSEFIQMWRKIESMAFAPQNSRLLIWICIGPLFLLAAAVVALLAHAPFNALVLLVSVLGIALSWKVSERVGSAIVAAVVIFALFCFQSLTRDLWIWNAFWLITVTLGLGVSVFSIIEAKRYFHNESDRLQELLKDRDLWQSRFETIKEKIEQDREVWEREIDLAKEELAEKQGHVDSLRTLIEVTHREASVASKRMCELNEEVEKMWAEKRVSNTDTQPLTLDGKLITDQELKRIIDELNHFRTEYHQIHLLYEESKEKLKSQDALVQERQARNNTLLGTNNSKSISVKDLAKGL